MLGRSARPAKSCRRAGWQTSPEQTWWPAWQLLWAGMVKEPLHPFLTALSACVSALSRNSYTLQQRSRKHRSQGLGLSQKAAAHQKPFAISSATNLALGLPCRTPLGLIGYAHVSADDQELTPQRTALKQAGCKRIYPEWRVSERAGRDRLSSQSGPRRRS